MTLSLSRRICLTAAAFALSAPAVATAGPPAPTAGINAVTVNLLCESSARRYFCETWSFDAVAPVSRQWFLNGVHIPAFNNNISINNACAAGSTTRVRVVMTAANGTGETTRSIFCSGGPPR